jgi:serine/threonine protein kinase
MAVPQAPASQALGKYDLIKETTASSIATTWLARDPADGGRTVSILRLHRHVAKRPEVVDGFLAAVKKASAIVHPHVARILDSGNDNGEVFVVQEMVEGDTLAGLLRAAGAEGIPTPLVLRIAKDLTAALDAAHGGGVAHGELGPWQVLLGKDGSVKVAGFGVAHALSRIGLHGLKNVDRLAYGAPERVKAMAQSSTAAGGANPPDAKGDLFSIGCILWEALSKERLFQSKMEAAVVQKVLTAAVEPIGKRVAGLPPEVEELVDRCLAREPASRIGSAREALEMLRKVEDLAGTEDDLGAHVERLCGAAIRARVEEARKPSMAPRGPAAPKPRTATLLGVAATGLADAREKATQIMAAGRVLPPDEESTLVRPVPARVATADLEEVSVDVDMDSASPEAAAARVAPPPRKPAPPPAPPGRSVGAATPGTPLRGAPPAAPKRPAGTMMGMMAPTAPAAARPMGKPPIEDEKTNEITDWVSAQEESGSGDDAVKAALDAAMGTSPKPAATNGAAPDVSKFAPPPAEPPPKQHAVVQPSRAGEVGGPIEKGAQLGSYEVLIPVARGGMASVWAGRTRGAQGIADLVAIKTLLPELDDDPEFHKMFRDETRVASRIRHANVAGLFAVGEHGDVPYLVMEWVDGDTLAALLRAAKPLGGIPQGIVLRIASDVCAGLHAAHELKDDAGVSLDVVHRDITPANVLLTSGGVAKVVDFGVAKSKSQLHVTRAGGVVKGKTPYLSPEQLGGLPLDRRSDLFSLGTMLYVLTTGLHPFRGENDLKTLENIAIKKPVPLRSIVPWIDPAFEALVLKLLEKDPRQRLTSASEVKAEIDRVLDTLDEPCGTADVAAFLRKALGHQLDDRTRELEAAAEELDRKRGSLQPNKVVIDVPAPPSFDAPGNAVVPAPVVSAAAAASGAAKDTPPKELDAPIPVPVAAAAAVIDEPVRTLGEGLAEEPLEDALSRNEDTQRNRALTLRRRRLGQLVGLAVGAGVVVIALAVMLSGGDDDATSKTTPTARPTAVERTAEPKPPPAPEPTVTAEPVATAEPAPSVEPTADPAPTAEPVATAEPPPVATPKPTAAPPPRPPPPRQPPRPPTTRPGGKPPKKPPVFNPQGI